MVQAKDRDQFGHCISCHKYLLREVIDRGQILLVPTPDQDSELLLLNDGSQMRVNICKSCKEELTDTDFPYLMDAAIKGWDWETDQLVRDPKKSHWDDKEKKKYMTRQRKLKIVTRPEGLDKVEIENRLKKFKSKKKVKL